VFSALIEIDVGAEKGAAGGPPAEFFSCAGLRWRFAPIGG
jgi:hypothetical protein